MNDALQPSQSCLTLIRHSEGFKPTAYWDNGGWACGYGCHGSDIVEGTVWTLEEAEVRLEDKVNGICDEIKHIVKVPLTQGQFDALVDFTYNLGAGRLAQSTLLRELNNGEYASAGQQLLLWDFAAGKQNPGLEERRKAELALWNGELV